MTDAAEWDRLVSSHMHHRFEVQQNHDLLHGPGCRCAGYLELVEQIEGEYQAWAEAIEADA